MVYLKHDIENEYTIRRALEADIAELRDLYRNTILAVNKHNYSQIEVDDWASCGDDWVRWKELITTHHFIIAENSKSFIVGFSSITLQGYLQSMFVHKDFQGKGIATLLLKKIEQHAKENKIAGITSEVSVTARPFFEKQGYTVQVEQKRKANLLYLTNYWMKKEL